MGEDVSDYLERIDALPEELARLILRELLGFWGNHSGEALRVAADKHGYTWDGKEWVKK